MLICNSHVGNLSMRAAGVSNVTLVNSTVAILSGGAGKVTLIGSTITTNNSAATVVNQ
jgi:hypothetical protein